MAKPKRASNVSNASDESSLSSELEWNDEELRASYHVGYATDALPRYATPETVLTGKVYSGIRGGASLQSDGLNPREGGDVTVDSREEDDAPESPEYVQPSQCDITADTARPSDTSC